MNPCESWADAATSGRRRAIFLDRDGVINEDLGYVSRIEDFRLMDGVVDGLRALSDLGFSLIIITNQSGIGRGFYSQSDYEALTAAYTARLSAAGVKLTDILHCPHQPADHCDCRKPRPGMLFTAAQRWDLDLGNSYLVGDKQSDIDAGTSAGLRACVHIAPAGAPADTPTGATALEVAATPTARDLREAALIIRQLVEATPRGHQPALPLQHAP